MSSPAEFGPAEANIAMRSFIRRIATGPEMSKDLSREEARTGMALILGQKVDPVQRGIFLIALRMKRETDEENLGVLDALREATRSARARVGDVVTLTDPFNGYTRCLPASPFLPPVLAACGVGAVSQGLERVGPKFGVTHRMVLAAVGAPVDLSPEEAAAKVEDPAVGWAYVDQRRYSPALHELVELRTLMVKRSAVTTAEVIPMAIQGERNHLVTGYVHKPYPRIYALLARAAGYDSSLLVRGVEGGVIPSLRQQATIFRYLGDDPEIALEMDPRTLGITQTVRSVPIPPGLGGGTNPEEDEVSVNIDVQAVAQASATAGLEALEGRSGPTRDSLVYGAALCLVHLGRQTSMEAAAAAVREVLDSGAAARRLRG